MNTYTIKSSRKFNYPIEIIFEAWANPEYLKIWWGPKGFTNTFLTFNFRLGGNWKFIMHGPDKGNYENECEFTKIEKPHFISWRRISKPLFNVEVEFTALSNTETELVFTMIFENAKEYKTIKPIAIEKNEENFDRLETLLSQM